MALPVTTDRAALAAAHPLHLVEPEAAPSERLPARRPQVPFSCSTNLANDVTEQLRQAKLGSRALEVCLYLYRQTFGNAGWHRKQGREEWWCTFDLAAWAEALACNKSNLRRIRTELEACHIICFEPDAAHPGQGRLGWNLAFREWLPYDGRRGGQSRRTNLAGRQQEDVVILPQQESIVISPQQENVVISACEQRDVVIYTRPLDELRQERARTSEQRDVVISPGAGVSPLAAKQLRQVDEKHCKTTTPAPSEVAQQGIRGAAKRKGLRKKAPETPDVVSAANASPREPVDLGRNTQSEMAPRPGDKSLHDTPTAPEIALQVPAEQVALWREDVAEQRLVVAQLQAASARASEALQQCSPSGPGWGELRRQQRYWQHQLEAAQGKLAQFTQFVTLIEQGATKDEACAAVLGQAANDSDGEEEPEGAPAAEAVQADPPPTVAPRLEGQALRRALFATLVRLFTSGDPRHVELERGKFNKAIKNFVLAGLQPGDLPAVQAAFGRLWPCATCTALGLANNLPLLMGTAEGMGWQFQTAKMST
ncbi:MAG TPA: hypothetical protein VKT82_12080 [Ktedonobacterales bacterium]|nr:hypothetical protein [Ktedonobacterales bacterium]